MLRRHVKKTVHAYKAVICVWYLQCLGTRPGHCRAIRELAEVAKLGLGVIICPFSIFQRYVRQPEPKRTSNFNHMAWYLLSHFFGFIPGFHFRCLTL